MEQTGSNEDRQWPPERVQELTELWKAGHLSASQIGERLGVTRNAVLGKVHRIPDMPSRKRKNYVAPKRKLNPPPAARWKPRPTFAPCREREVIVEQPFLNLKLDELKGGVCHYPRGDRPPYFFCGQPIKHGSPYCALHNRIVHRHDYHRPAPPPDWRGVA